LEDGPERCVGWRGMRERIRVQQRKPRPEARRRI
jgi:hypothetical protein